MTDTPVNPGATRGDGERRPGFFSSFKTRLILLLTLQVLLVLGALGFLIYGTLRDFLEASIERELTQTAQLIAARLDPILVSALRPGRPDSRTYRHVHQDLISYRNQLGLRRVFLLGEDLAPLTDTGSEAASMLDLTFFDTELAALRPDGGTWSSPLFRGEDGILYKWAFAAGEASGERRFVVGVEGSAARLDLVATMGRRLLLFGAAGLAVSFGLALGISNLLSAPIRRLGREAQRIGRGELERAIDPGGPEELARLIAAFEEMRQGILKRDQWQKAMLAGVAHELRNPLGGIELFAGLLHDDLTDEQLRERANRIVSEVNNLKAIIQTFLDFAAPKSPTRQPVNVRAIWDEAWDLGAPGPGDVRVRWDDSSASPCRVLCDPGQLRQVFLNLITNALQALDGEGEIAVQVTRSRGWVRFRLSDSGPGIPADIRQRIFEPFFTTREAGSGLGLAIVKHLLALNGGDIRLEESGDGGSFVLDMPAAEK